MLYALFVASAIQAAIIAVMIRHLVVERRALGFMRSRVMDLRNRVIGLEDVCVSIEDQVAKVKQFALDIREDARP